MMESSNTGSSSHRVKSIFDLEDEESDIEGSDEPSSVQAPEAPSKETIIDDSEDPTTEKLLPVNDDARSTSPIIGKPMNYKKSNKDEEANSSCTSSSALNIKQKISSADEMPNFGKVNDTSSSRGLQDASSDESDNDFTGFDIPDGGNVSNSSTGDFAGFEVNSLGVRVELNMSPVNDSTEFEEPVITDEQGDDPVEKKFNIDSLSDDRRCVPASSAGAAQQKQTKGLASEGTPISALTDEGSASAVKLSDGQVPLVKIEPEMEYVEESPSNIERDGFFDMPSPNAAGFPADATGRVRVEDVYTDSDNDGTDGSLLQAALKNSMGDSNKDLLARMRTKASARVDLEAMAAPFAQGWKREVVHRSSSTENPEKRATADVYYFTPNNKKLRSVVEVEKYLSENRVQTLSTANFCFGRYPLGMDPSVERVRLSKAHGKRKLAQAVGDVGSGDMSAVPFKKRKVELSSAYSSSTSLDGTMGTRHFMDPGATSPLHVPDTSPVTPKTRGPLQGADPFNVSLNSGDGLADTGAPDNLKTGTDAPSDLRGVISRDCEVIMQRLNPGVTRAQYPLYDAGTEAASSWNQSLCRIGRPLRLGTTPASHVIEPPREPWGARQPRLMAGPRIITPLVKGSEAEKTYHCTAHCNGVHSALPSLPCVKCRCLFHPQCIHLPYSLTHLIVNLTYKLMCPNCYLEAKRKASDVKVPPNPVKPYEPLSYEDDPSTSSYSDYSDADEGVGSDVENLDPMNPALLEVDLRPPTPTTPDYSLESYFPPPGTTEQQQRSMALEALHNLGPASAEGTLSGKAPRPQQQQQLQKIKIGGNQTWANSNVKQRLATGDASASSMASLAGLEQPRVASASDAATQRADRLQLAPGLPVQQQQQLLMSASQQPLLTLQQQLLQSGQHMLAQPELQQQPNIPALLQGVINSYQMLEKMKVPENQEATVGTTQKMPSFKNYARDISLGYGVIKQVLQKLSPLHLLQAARTCVMWRDLALSPHMWRVVHLSHDTCRVTSWPALASFLDHRGCVSLAVTGPLMAPPPCQGRKKKKTPETKSPTLCPASKTAVSPVREMEASESLNDDRSPPSVVGTDLSPEVVSVGGESFAGGAEPMEVEHDHKEDDEDDHVTPGAAAHAFEELDDNDPESHAVSSFDDSEDENTARRRRRDTVLEDLESPSKDDSSSDSDELDITAVSPAPSTEATASSLLLAQTKDSFTTESHLDRADGSESEKCGLEARENAAEAQKNEEQLDSMMEVDRSGKEDSDSTPKKPVGKDSSHSTDFESARKAAGLEGDYKKTTENIEAESEEVENSVKDSAHGDEPKNSKEKDSVDVVNENFGEKVVGKTDECAAISSKTSTETGNTEIETSSKKSDTMTDKPIVGSAHVDVDTNEISVGDSQSLLKKDSIKEKTDENLIDKSNDSSASFTTNERTDKTTGETVEDMKMDCKNEAFFPTGEIIKDVTQEGAEAVPGDTSGELAKSLHESSSETEGEKITLKSVSKSPDDIDDDNKNANNTQLESSSEVEALEPRLPVSGVAIQEHIASDIAAESCPTDIAEIGETAKGSKIDLPDDKAVVTEASASDEKTSEKEKEDSSVIFSRPAKPSAMERKDSPEAVSPVKLSETGEKHSSEEVTSSVKSDVENKDFPEVSPNPAKSSPDEEKDSLEVIINPAKSTVNSDENVKLDAADTLTSDSYLEQKSSLANQTFKGMGAETPTSPSMKPASPEERETIDFKKEKSPTSKAGETAVESEASDQTESKPTFTILSPASQCEPETLSATSDTHSSSKAKEMLLFGEDPAAPCFTVFDNDSSTESDSGEPVTVTNVIKGEVHSQDSVANSPVDEKAKPDISVIHDSTSPVSDPKERNFSPKIESHDPDVEPMDVDDASAECRSISPKDSTLLLKRERISKSPDVEITSTFDPSGLNNRAVNEIKTMDSDTSRDSVPVLTREIKGELNENSCDNSVMGRNSPLPECGLKRSLSISAENSRDYSSTCSPGNPFPESLAHSINDETQGSVLSDLGDSMDASGAKITAANENTRAAKESGTKLLPSTNEGGSPSTAARTVIIPTKEVSDKSEHCADASSESDLEAHDAEDRAREEEHTDKEARMEAEDQTHGERISDLDDDVEMGEDDRACVERERDDPHEEQSQDVGENEVDERSRLVSGWRCACTSLGSMTHLRELIISDCREGLLELLLPHCSRLTALRVSKLGHRPSNSIVRFDSSSLLHAVNLEELHLSGHFTFTSNFNFIKMRKLKKLGLIGAQLARWPYLGTSLTHLYVSPVDRFTSDTWSNVAAMTDLVDLSLGEFSEGVADSSWYVSLSRLPALQRLALTDCALGPRLLVLLKKFPQLNKIVLKPRSQHPTLSLPDQLWRVKHVWTLLPCSLRLLCDASDLTVAASGKDPTALPGLVFANSGSKTTDQDGRQSASLQHVALSKLPQFFSRRSSTRAACFSFKILNDEETPIFPYHFNN